MPAILFLTHRRNNQPDVLQEFHLAQGGIGAKVGESDLARQAFQGPQIGHQALIFRIVRIGIRIAGNFRKRVQRALGRGMIAEHAIAAAHLFELSQSVLPAAGAAPHLFTLNK